MLLIGNVVAAIKHHVFKKMGKPRFTYLLSCRTYMVGNIYMYYRIAMILMYNKRKAVRQHILFVRNNYFVTCFSNFFNQLSLCKSTSANDKKCSSKHPDFLFHYVYF